MQVLLTAVFASCLAGVRAQAGPYDQCDSVVFALFNVCYMLIFARWWWIVFGKHQLHVGLPMYFMESLYGSYAFRWQATVKSYLSQTITSAFRLRLRARKHR